ncbi:FixH family protein [Salipaludibacillus sp. CF4.18]|uniref:FixH family protein n=1 Tax=Salipaludibacillus sp. CF4.18 TaxID=3373081 RepID=UPI003EE5BE68
MNKILKLIFSTLLILTLAACGQEEDNNDSGMQSVDDINLDPVDAKLTIPDKADVDEDLVFQVLVTQGEEMVDDASEVTFEVWADGEKSESEMIEAELPGEEGLYELSHTFSEEKLYHVQSHVTARGSHAMPVKEIVIGEPDLDLEVENDEAEQQDTNEEENHVHEHEGNNQDENEDNSDHHHMNESIDIRWQTSEQASASENVSLEVEIDWKGDPWTGGKVQFEVWKHGDEHHEWISAEETDSGVYKTEHVFEETGEFHVTVHLEDDELHEHKQFLIEIE